MTDQSWRPKLSRYYADRLAKLEARGYQFEFAENGHGREITVKRGERVIGTATGILAPYVAGEALALIGRVA